MSSHQPPRLLDQVREAIRLKHFSLKTEKSYVRVRAIAEAVGAGLADELTALPLTKRQNPPLQVLMAIAVGDAQHDVEDAQHDVEDAQHDIEDAQHDIGDVQHDIEDAQYDIEDAQHDIGDVQHDIEDAQHDIGDAQHNIEGLQCNT